MIVRRRVVVRRGVVVCRSVVVRRGWCVAFVVTGIEMKERVEDGKWRRERSLGLGLLLLEIVEELVEVDSAQKGIQGLEPEAPHFWRERFARFPGISDSTSRTPQALHRAQREGWGRGERVGGWGSGVGGVGGVGGGRGGVGGGCGGRL